MTENNYTVGYFDEPTNIDDYVECNGSYLSSSEVVELLNELYEERNYFERKKCEYQKKISILITDKIQLKQENEQLKDALNQRTDQCDKYYKKKEQLKTVNTHLKNELSWIKDYAYWKEKDAFNRLFGAYVETCDEYRMLVKENEQLKSQLYYDGEEGVCNICKHHYLVKDDESEWGYYNSRCKKGHYECARVSLKHCEDFEKELKSE